MKLRSNFLLLLFVLKKSLKLHHMNILIIGGSGLLGTFAATEALERGHKVTILSRRKSNNNDNKELHIVQGDLHTMNENDLAEVIKGHDALIYSYNIDDREIQKRPAYNSFQYDHVVVCNKVLHAAKKQGVKKFVLYGSYFTYFDQSFPELNLSENHVYIKTRSEQKNLILNSANDDFKTYVLELPYILGHLPGKVPPWTLFFSMLSGIGKYACFFTNGGTAATTATQVAIASVKILENNIPTMSCPVVGVHLKWTDIAQAYFEVTGKNKKLIELPKSLFKIFGHISSFGLWIIGKERGLSLSRFAEFQYSEAFIDPEVSMKTLGYTHDEYQKALKGVIAEWISINKRESSI